MFDSEQQRQFFIELLTQATYPGHLVRFAAEQMEAVERSEIWTGDDPTAPVTTPPGRQAA